MLYERTQKNWEGKWIWDVGNGQKENQNYLFRKEFIANDLKSSATLFITATNRYRLYVNGAFLGSGPPSAQPFYQYYDSYDICPYLVKGVNTIAVEVNYTGTWFSNTRAGLLLECIQSGQVVIKSDEDFKLLDAPAWNRSISQKHTSNKTLGFQEIYDMRREPEGWKLNGFDDSRWHYASVIGGRFSNTPPQVQPWNFLIPRNIPYMKLTPHLPVDIFEISECQDTAETVNGKGSIVNISDQMSIDVMVPIKYSQVHDIENLKKDDQSYATLQCSTLHYNQDVYFDRIYNPCFVLDFGKVLPAYIEIDVEGPEGAYIDIGHAERLIDGKFVSSFLNVKFVDRLYLKNGRQTFRTFYWKSFQYVKLKIRDSFEPLKIHSIKAIASNYPYEYRGSFTSSDSFYDRLWEAGRYTIQICSNDSYMDTPWREQAEWSGDVAAVTVGGTYAAFGDTRLPYKFLKESGNALNPIGLITNLVNGFSPDWNSIIPDYSLWWVQAVWNHYMYTGDEEIIHGLYPHVIRILQFFEASRNDAGMLANLGTWVLIDWADIDRKGECAPLNALYIGTLDYIRKIAEFKNDKYIIEYCDNTSIEMKEVFNKRYWCEEKGAYSDSLYNGKLSDKVSEHNNLFAILYDIAPLDRKRTIIKNFYEDKSVSYTEAQPFITFAVMCALKKEGRLDIAMDIMKKRWSRMLDNGATSMWEEWGINGSWRDGDKLLTRFRSLSHAWSSGPVEFLSKWLTGIEIAEPGCKKLRIKPLSGGLESYKVIYPTPLGDIQISVNNGKADIKLPDGIELVV